MIPKKRRRRSPLAFLAGIPPGLLSLTREKKVRTEISNTDLTNRYEERNVELLILTERHPPRR